MPRENSLLSLVLRVTGSSCLLAAIAAALISLLFMTPMAEGVHLRDTISLALFSGLLFGLIVGPPTALTVVWLKGAAALDSRDLWIYALFMALVAGGCFFAMGYGHVLTTNLPISAAFAEAVALVVGSLIISQGLARRYLRELAQRKRKARAG